MPLVQTFANASARGWGEFLPSTAAGAYEHIQTITATGGISTLTFSSLPQTYKHLQIRAIFKDTSTYQDLYVRFNNDSSSVYNNIYLKGNGSGVVTNASYYAAYSRINQGLQSNGGTAVAPAIIDIPDYTSTTNFKSAKILHGLHDGGNYGIYQEGDGWASTSAINSISIYYAGTFSSLTVASIYGIKG